MEHQQHHKRELKFLISFLVIFVITFFIALTNLKRGLPLFGIGIPYLLENWLVLLLSLFSIVKVFWNIITQ